MRSGFGNIVVSSIAIAALALMIATIGLGKLDVRPAYAYSLTGAYWLGEEHGTPCGKNSANYPQGMLSCTIGVVTTAALNSHSGWQTTNSNAANQWWTYDSNYAVVAFNYETTSGTSDVTVDATDLGGPDAHGYTIYGQTSWNYFLPNQMSHANISITTNSTVSWCVDAVASCPTSNTVDMEHVMTHELGHALGLSHPVAGPNSWAVMECSMALGEGSLAQSDDIRGAHYLYASGSWGSPGSIPC